MTGDIAVSGVIDTVEQLRTIPAGTVIGDPEGTECYRRGPRGGWHRYDRASGAESALRGDPPTGLVVLQGAPGTLLEPLDQFKLRFRDHAWAKSEQFSTSFRVTERALQSLGCNELPWLTGAPVISNWSKEHLPTGVTVSVGNPKQYDSYGVWAMKNGGLRHLLGGNTYLEGGVVLTVDGEVRLPVPVKNNADVLARFKSDCWKVVARTKSETGWCGTFNDLMREIGITADVMLPGPQSLPPGVDVDRDGASRLRQGAILWWQRDTFPQDNWVMYVRDDRHDTTARTRAVLHRRVDGVPVRHSAARMRVLGEPDSPGGMVSVRPPNGWNQDLWDQLPVGTRLDNIPGAANGQWVICGNHRADEYRYASNDVAGYTGRYRLADFNQDRLTIASFPTGENT